MAVDFDFLAARGLTGARMAGGLEDDLSGDKERIRALRRGVDGGLATMLSCQSRHQTDVHVLIKVQRCALNISSSSGFRNEDMVLFNVRYIYICQRTVPIMLWEPIQCNGSSHSIAI